MTLGPIGYRLAQVRGFMSLVRSPMNWLSLAVVAETRVVSKGPLSFLARRYFPELVGCPAVLGTLGVALNPSDLRHMICFNEVYRERAYDLDLVPFTPDQIFDCGGHIGMFSLLARSRYPTVPLVIFEPNPRNV